jgi:hypothetical protein
VICEGSKAIFSSSSRSVLLSDAQGFRIERYAALQATLAHYAHAALAALAALLRGNLQFFVWKCFKTILPGTPYLPNWHVDAIVHQLMRVQGGRGLSAPHQPTAALVKINLRLGRFYRLVA